MEFELSRSVAVLERTPLVLDAWLRGLPDDWTRRNEGPDTWSPFDVVGHLIHGDEADWIPRARMILDHGESRPFEPFDRHAQFEKSKGRSLDELLDRFAQARRKSLEALAAMKLSTDQLGLRGRHPEFGPVTLRQLLATWTAHDLGHLTQIGRVMCRQYREAVGPWRAYLSALR